MGMSENVVYPPNDQFDWVNDDNALELGVPYFQTNPHTDLRPQDCGFH